MNKKEIMNCDFNLKQCDKNWSELEKTESEDKRFCHGCERMVLKVNNYEELVKVVKQKKCVAYYVGDESTFEDESPLVGMIIPGGFEDDDKYETAED